MFELEMINLLNKLKNSSEDKIEEIKKSLSELISKNKEEYEKFFSKEASTFNQQTLDILKECEAKSLEKTEEKNPQTQVNENSPDSDIIKKQYEKWLEIYTKNNKQITDENTKIIDDIINYYIDSKFEVITQILTIKSTMDYEDFKWHLKNKIRAHFATKIEEYLNTTYPQLSFFDKFKKKKQIVRLTNKIGKYEFDIKNIEEVLK